MEEHPDDPNILLDDAHCSRELVAAGVGLNGPRVEFRIHCDDGTNVGGFMPPMRAAELGRNLITLASEALGAMRSKRADGPRERDITDMAHKFDRLTKEAE